MGIESSKGLTSAGSNMLLVPSHTTGKNNKVFQRVSSTEQGKQHDPKN